MRILYRLAALFRALFRSGRVDADLAQEMRFHIERETQANISRGMSPDAALRDARLTFGSVDAAHEHSRDERPGVGLRQFLQDVRFGARLNWKSPGFSIAAVAITALGIGAATAVFSVVYGVVLEPLPFRQADRLVTVWLTRGAEHARLYPSAADAIDLRELRVFSDVAFMDNENLNLLGGDEPRRLQGARVSANVFSVLGASAALGRTFLPEENQAGRNQVIILSDALWRGRFGADPGIVGQQVRLDATQYTVVGVMPSNFRYPWTTHEAWVPLVVDPRELTREEIDNYRVIGRLAPGVSRDAAQRAASALGARLAAAAGVTSNAGMAVDGMLDDAVRTVRPALRLLLGAVGFLLLIACVNLSNLFGARATARSGEFAVRLALGASRARLVAQAVAESVPVLALGGMLGIVAAEWAMRAFVVAAPAGLPRVENVALSMPVVVCSLAMLVLTGVAASLAPAFDALRSDFTTITKDGGRSSTTGRARSVARRLGVAVQVAFALPLLVGASVLLRSALNLTRVDLGFTPDRVATVSLEVSRARHPSDDEVANYYARLIEAVHAVPGVREASLVNRIPLLGAQSNSLQFENAAGTSEDLTDVDSRTITPEYFATLGIRLTAGRNFTDRDAADAPMVGIVDERVARTIWPGESPIGKRFRLPSRPWTTVVGVVGHVRTTGLDVDPRPQVYWSYRQWTQNRMVLAVRSEVDPRTLFGPVTKAIHSVDPDQAVFEPRTMSDLVDRSLAQRRLTTGLIVGFGCAALLLAAVGIYGVVSYGVTQRMREFGIRVALGARPAEVAGLVVRQGTSMAVVGAVIGLTLALAAAGVMSSLVYGVAPRDALSVFAATGLLLGVAVAASYVPARRGASVDPGVTLRSE